MLFKSTRLHQDNLGQHWVLFAPDTRGFPVVVADRVMRVLDSYSGGATFDAVAELMKNQHMEIDELRTIVDSLVRLTFLRPKEDSRRYEAKDLAAHTPDTFSVWLHINNHCNLDCAYCFVDKSDAEMSDEIIDQTVAQLAKTVRNRGIRRFALKFAGGEPTLSIPRMELFYDKLQDALRGTDCKWSTAILSNGTVMSDRLIRFLKRPNVGISISVDGYGPAGHDIFRVFKDTRRGSWDIIERNIARAMEHGIRPYIMATVSQESSRTLPELVKWIYSRGLRARLSVVRQPETKEAYSSFRQTATRASVAEEYHGLIATVTEAFELAFQELEKDSYVLDVRNGLHICELHFESPSFTSCCGIGSSHVVINEKGEFASCPMTVHRDTVAATNGDVLTSTGLTFSRFGPRDREQNEGKNCLDCKFFPVCVSGCPINNLAVNGKPYSVSPLNPFYEYVIPRYVQFFGRKLLQCARRKGIEKFLLLSS
jgi:uncharacterized protein